MRNSIPLFSSVPTTVVIWVDPSKLLDVGESAGGYLSIQSGISRPDLVEAVTATYPMLGMDPGIYTRPGRKPILGAPELPVSVVEEHVANMPRDMDGISKPMSDDDPPTMFSLRTAAVQHGLIPEFLGDNEKMLPMQRVLKGPFKPVLFIAHGEDDTAVPVSGRTNLLTC